MLNSQRRESRLFICNRLTRFRDNLFRSETEKLQQILERGRCSKPVHPNLSALQTYVMLPATPPRHFNGTSGGDGRAPNTVLFSLLLIAENLPRRHASHASLPSLGLEFF